MDGGPMQHIYNKTIISIFCVTGFFSVRAGEKPWRVTTNSKGGWQKPTLVLQIASHDAIMSSAQHQADQMNRAGGGLPRTLAVQPKVMEVITKPLEIKTFADAYAIIAKDQTLFQQYKEQSLSFINGLTHATRSESPVDHFACFEKIADIKGAPVEANVQLLKPMLETQQKLASIIFNSDGTYRGFTCEEDYQKWAWVVSSYMENCYFRGDSVAHAEAIKALGESGCRGFKFVVGKPFSIWNTLEYTTKARFIIKYWGFYRWSVHERIDNEFNTDIRQFDSALRSNNILKAKAILERYEHKIGKNRADRKTISEQAGLLKKLFVCHERSLAGQSKITLAHKSEEPPFEYLQLPNAFDCVETTLNSDERVNLCSFEARQNEIIAKEHDPLKRAYVACETDFALDFYRVQSTGILDEFPVSMTAELSSSAIITARVNFQDMPIASLKQYMEHLAGSFEQLDPKHGVGQALLILDSIGSEIDVIATPQLLTEVKRHLSGNLNDIGRFCRNMSEEYGKGINIFDEAQQRSLTVSSAECSHENARKLFVKKIADHITLKILIAHPEMQSKIAAAKEGCLSSSQPTCSSSHVEVLTQSVQQQTLQVHESGIILDNTPITASSNEHATDFVTTGANYLATREDALNRAAYGEGTIERKEYALSPEAVQELKAVGIDVQEFAECTGNAMQQDTQEKLVSIVNVLPEVYPQVLADTGIKEMLIGQVVEAQTSNNYGDIATSTYCTDMCTTAIGKIVDLLDCVNPFTRALDGVAERLPEHLQAAGAASLEKVRVDTNEFTKGFLTGALSGITDIRGIYEGLCDTGKALGYFARYVCEQEALGDALEFGRFEDARAILNANEQAGIRFRASIEHAKQNFNEFIGRAPGMTAAEWREAGHQTGAFLAREFAQLRAMNVGLSGAAELGKLAAEGASELSNSARKIALALQLSENPTAPTVTNIFRQGHRIENVLTQTGSKHISGIQAVHPELATGAIAGKIAPIIDAVGETVAQVGAEVNSKAVTALNAAKQVGQALTEAKPGFIDFGGAKKNNSGIIPQNIVQWTNHAYKHFSQKSSPWKEIVRSTKAGPAKYLPGLDVEMLERDIWQNGIPTTNSKPWKVMKLDRIIGAKNGIETMCIRVECSANTIHGHPITPAEFMELTK